MLYIVAIKYTILENLTSTGSKCVKQLANPTSDCGVSAAAIQSWVGVLIMKNAGLNEPCEDDPKLLLNASITFHPG